MKLLLCSLAFVITASLARADEPFDPEPVVSLFELVAENTDDPQAARECLGVLAEKTQTGELSAEAVKALRDRLQPALAKIVSNQKHPLFLEATLLSAAWKDEQALAAVRGLVMSSMYDESGRLKGLQALIAAGDNSIDKTIEGILSNPANNSADFRAAAIAAMGRSTSSRIADILLASYGKLEPGLRPKAIEVLTQRPVWAKAIMAAIGRGDLPATVLNANQIARLQRSRDQELVELVKAKWGTVRTERNQEREQVIAGIRDVIRNTPGDAFRGEKVFKTLCAQCHKIYGEGQDVGPDLTSNGRNDFEQLLSNVFDPSLVIGSAYQLHTVIDSDGRAISGLLVEDSRERVVLKLQGGKLETVPRHKVDEITASPLSMMPEDIEKQFKPQEIADLFAFLTLDKHPSDRTAKRLPGVRQ